MDKFEMLEKLQDAGIDVAGELVRAMTSDQAEELLGYIANVWDVEEGEDEKMSVKDYYGNEIDFAEAATFMDDDIREQLHRQIAPCTEQEFFDAYAEAHAEKFDGDEFAPYYNLAW